MELRDDDEQPGLQIQIMKPKKEDRLSNFLKMMEAERAMTPKSIAARPSEETVPLQRMVSCAVADREMAGSCNACGTHADYKVICIEMRCIGVRVCKSCAALLLTELQRAANDRTELRLPGSAATTKPKI
jgi:hypothetical protein